MVWAWPPITMMTSLQEFYVRRMHWLITSFIVNMHLKVSCVTIFNLGPVGLTMVIVIVYLLR